MKAFGLSSRSTNVLYALLVAALILFSLNIFGLSGESAYEEFFEGKAKIREGAIKAENVNASPLQPASVAAASARVSTISCVTLKNHKGSLPR